VARSGDKKLFRKHGRIIGEEVRALGFNTDFAPVLDLGFAASRKVLGSRTVSVDPKATITYAREFLRGLRDARVLGCGKHFPGLGEADLDTHKELPQVLKPWKRLWAEDLLPYRELRREMAFVMVAHAAYPAVSRDGAPASLSKKWIGDILRKKIGYTGLVVSDDLEMGGVMAAASIEDAAIETIRAGADMFLVCHNEEHVWRTHKAVLRQAERDRRFAARVHQAAARVLSFKKKSRELKHRPPQPSATTLKKLSRELWELGEQVRLEAL
jgi:beta-N-acetylhexosaminidase